MFACLYGLSPRLAELAGQFSPLIEKPDAGAVVFSLAGLSKLFGDWRQIASEISRRGADLGVVANLAIARDKTTAVLAARHLRGVTIIAPGQEASSLSEISIEALQKLAPQHKAAVSVPSGEAAASCGSLPGEPELLATLRRWGIRTLGDLAALPEIGVRERLGEAGCRLRRIALGQGEDWLRLSRPPEQYTAREELDYPVELLEPLLFVISAQLRDLTAKLQRNGQAARRIAITATLDSPETRGATEPGAAGRSEFPDSARDAPALCRSEGEALRSVELPLAMRDPQALLKQIQLCLEAKPLGAPVTAIQIALDPADPRVVQGELFQPAAPEPEKLQTLLARLSALTGSNRVDRRSLLTRTGRMRFVCALARSNLPIPPPRLPLRSVWRFVIFALPFPLE